VSASFSTALPIQIKEKLEYVATDVFANMHKKHLLVIMGPAGCGKTSVATALADMLGMPMVEGDDVRAPGRDL